MEPLEGPRIAIQHIRLLKANIEMVNAEGKREYNLRLVGLRRVESEDAKMLTIDAAFDMMHGIEKPLFKFTCEFIAIYKREDDQSMPWKDLTSAMALAHIIPYLREFVSNMTNRLPAPIIMLDPLNTHAMITDYEHRRHQADQAKVKPTPSQN